MVKIKNVEKIDNVINCDAFFEDCKKAVSIVFDIDNQKITAGDLPVGYEWCAGHVKYIKYRLQEMCESDNIKREATIMWY